MKKIAKFHKVSFEQFKKDWDLTNDPTIIYEQISLPKERQKDQPDMIFSVLLTLL